LKVFDEKLNIFNISNFDIRDEYKELVSEIISDTNNSETEDKFKGRQ